MKFSSTIIITALILTAASITTATAQSRQVTGAASASFFGQVTEATLAKARVEAAAHFREELKIWLRENHRIDIDTVNTVKKLALRKFAERCLERAEEKTVTRGRVWTLSLSVSEGFVRDALVAHNRHYDSQASSLFMSADDPDPNAALSAAVAALCAATSKIEPANSSGGVNINEIRTRAQGLLDRMQVRSPETVIEGRPGSLPQKSPTAVFMIDSIPLTDFHVTAFVQNNRQFARLTTDSRGELPLRGYKVPFVHNGSMLTISPDARHFLKANEFIRYRDLGLRFTRGQDLTFIFKVPTLTYTLEYQVFTKESDITIPPDFRSDAHIRKYLKEICGLVPASSGAMADLTIRIGAEISRHTYDDTEEDAIRLASRADFRGAGIEKSHQEVFEKRQRFGLSFQMGAYFWEASGALRDLMTNTLAKD